MSKVHVHDGAWYITVAEYPNADVSLFTWSTSTEPSHFKCEGVIADCVAKNGQPDRMEDKFVHISTISGSVHQLKLSQITKTSHVLNSGNNPKEFRKSLMHHLTKMKARSDVISAKTTKVDGVSMIQDTMSQRFTKGSKITLDDQSDFEEADISSPVVPPITKRKSVDVGLDYVKKSKNEADDDDVLNHKSISTIRADVLKSSGKPDNAIVIQDTIQGPGVERPEALQGYQEKQVMEALNKACDERYIGEFSCNPACLSQPPDQLLVREINKAFVKTLVARLKESQNPAVAPLIAMVLDDIKSGTLSEDKFKTLLQKKRVVVIGGNHTRAAYLMLAKQQNKDFHRKVLVYNLVPDHLARHLAVRHNLDNDAKLKMSFSEALNFAKQEYDTRGSKFDKELVAKQLDFKSAESIGNWFTIIKFPSDIWVKIEKILRGDYITKVETRKFNGEIKTVENPGEVPTSIAHLRKLIGLPHSDVHKLLDGVLVLGKSLQWMALEADTVRAIIRIRQAYVHCLHLETWEQVVSTFPSAVTESIVNGWITAFTQFANKSRGRKTKTISDCEIPPDFRDRCDELRRYQNLQDGSAIPGGILCDVELISHGTCQFGALCCEIDSIGRKVSRTDWRIITADLPSKWSEDANLKSKLHDLFLMLAGINTCKTPVWFILCDLACITTVICAMKDCGLGRIWSGVTPVIQRSAPSVPIPALKAVVCGTHNYTKQTCSGLQLASNQTNFFDVPTMKPPLSTDTHDKVCHTPKSPMLMQQLLSMVIEPGCKILELFARTGPAMEFAITQNCSCLSVDASEIATRYIYQSIHRVLNQDEMSYDNEHTGSSQAKCTDAKNNPISSGDNANLTENSSQDGSSSDA